MNGRDYGIDMRGHITPMAFGSDYTKELWLARAAAVRRLAKPGTLIVAPDVVIHTRRGVLTGRDDEPVEITVADLSDQTNGSGDVVMSASHLLRIAIERGEVLEAF